MAVTDGKVISGKYSGLVVDVNFYLGVTVGGIPVKGNISSVQLVGNTTKVDLVFSLKPIKGYYQVLVTWNTGEQSILEVNQKAFTELMNLQNNPTENLSESDIKFQAVVTIISLIVVIGAFIFVLASCGAFE